MRLAAAAALLAATILLAVFAGPLMRHANAVAGDLLKPSAYIEAVLGPRRYRSTQEASDEPRPARIPS